MTVLNYYPFLTRTEHFLLAFHGYIFSPSVDKLTEVDLVFKYHSDRSYVPVELPPPVIRLEVVRIMEIEVSDRSENFLLAEDFGGFIVTNPLRRHSEYPSYCLSGRLVNHKVMPVIGIELVTERWL